MKYEIDERPVFRLALTVSEAATITNALEVQCHHLRDIEPNVLESIARLKRQFEAMLAWGQRT